ncbi:uncharacterized protein LOC135496750 [Lineus longissimus]|uniref:uncharacterized protein LOC135496750 n=1 Tax=Lineus longissimus TaxID=88925 RepID=UPI00315DAA05
MTCTRCESSSGRQGHSVLGIILIVGAAVAFFITAIFNGAASSFGKDLGLFLNSTADISDIYSLDITPAGWVFSIWGLIYLWQAIFLVYGIASIFRKGEDGYLYRTPAVVPIQVYLLYIINMILNLTWIFFWDREMMITGLVVISMMVFTVHLMLFCSYRDFNAVALELKQWGWDREIWLVRILVHNAWAFYCGWISVATLLNFSIVLAYRGPVSVEDACTASLGVLTVELVLYFCIETFVYDRYLRYQFSQYIPVLLALIGGLTKNWDSTSRNSLFTAALLGIAGVLSIAKVVIMVVRHRRSPLPEQRESQTEQPAA